MLDILILQKDIQKELKKLKKIAVKLNYDEIEFLVQEKYFNKIEVKNNIWFQKSRAVKTKVYY